MSHGWQRGAAGLTLAGLLAACAPAAAPPPVDPSPPDAAFPADWRLPGFEGPLVVAGPAAGPWRRRGTWEAHDGRSGAVLLGPPMASPPPLPELLASLAPDAVPAALPGGAYRVFEGEGAAPPLWVRRFERTGQACAAFVRTAEAAADTGAWGYYCAAPGLPLADAELETALAALRWPAP